MVSVVYMVSVFLASLANYGYYRSSGSIGLRPDPYGKLALPYELAGFASWILVALLFIAGFFVLPWWLPPLAVLGCGVAAGIVYTRLPLGIEYAVIGFPLSMIATVVFAVLAFL